MKALAVLSIAVVIALACTGCDAPISADENNTATQRAVADDLPALVDTLPRDTGTVNGGQIDSAELP